MNADEDKHTYYLFNRFSWVSEDSVAACGECAAHGAGESTFAVGTCGWRGDTSGAN